MSDFFENNNPQEGESTETEYSVFSDPVAHKTVKVKKKNVAKRIIAGALTVTVLICSFVGLDHFGVFDKEEETENTSSASEENYIRQYESDDISTVTVNNSIGKTEFYSVSTKENDTLTTVEWFIRSLKKNLTDSYTIADVVEAVSTVSYSKIITTKDAQACGLEKPKVKAVVTPKKGKKYTLLLGEKSPDNMGYYAKIQGEDTIYLINDSVWEALDFALLDFADTTAIPGFTNDDGELAERFSNDQLSQFDKVVLKGKNHPEGTEIILNNDEKTSQYLGYLVVAPQKRIAKSTTELLMMYQGGLEVEGAYSYDVSAASLKKFGLDDPYLETTMYVLNKSITYKFAPQEDGYYAVVYDDSKLIHKVGADSLTGIIDLSTEDYYDSWIFYTMIDDYNQFKVTSGSESYAFSVKKNEAEEDEDTEQDDYIVKYKGEQLKGEYFQNLYQYCVSLRCSDFTEHNLTAKPSVTIELSLIEGGKSVIEFTKYDATKYQAKVDGTVMGKVSINSVDKVLTYVKKLANGEKIGEIA